MIMRTSKLRKDAIVTKTVVYWWMTITCLTILGKTGKCMATCPTVQQTARRVQRCPVNEAEWENAAMNKKCGQLHRNCTSHFKYHCALSVFLNETWEVCSPWRYLLGYCIEYNELGNRIQDNYMRDCSAMNPPCPSRYNSTEAYRYQECYQTVKPSPDIYKMTPSSTHTTMEHHLDSCTITLHCHFSCDISSGDYMHGAEEKIFNDKKPKEERHERS
ncbi:uncharacterized protein LOC125673023 isoform X2 [Ostrea edulis]|uniref:uncharacterized protein LOC125673023 isoform X2 n=1 Tax=Ostrea edulis TaxID=37623 RepID=UPI0024AF3938|nr:uncharacterized protein LOC125673023 isoform X2 [Ostrea edulis]